MAAQGHYPDLFSVVDPGQDVMRPYGGWNLEAMDSHGGWIASTADLARFAAASDNPDSCVLLRKESIDLMDERPSGLAGFEQEGTKKPVFYFPGRFNRVIADGQVNHWHTGSLDGTSTCMIRRHDGFSIVALLNSRVSPVATSVGSAVDRMLHAIADSSRATSLTHGDQSDILPTVRCPVPRALPSPSSV